MGFHDVQDGIILEFRCFWVHMIMEIFIFLLGDFLIFYENLKENV